MQGSAQSITQCIWPCWLCWWYQNMSASKDVGIILSFMLSFLKNYNIVGCKWLFLIKLNLDGSTDCYVQSTPCGQRLSWCARVHFNETFAFKHIRNLHYFLGVELIPSTNIKWSVYVPSLIDLLTTTKHQLHDASVSTNSTANNWCSSTFKSHSSWLIIQHQQAFSIHAHTHYHSSSTLKTSFSILSIPFTIWSC